MVSTRAALPRQRAWRLPVLLLSGLLMVFSVGAPALAAEAREHQNSPEGPSDPPGETSFAAFSGVPDVVVAAASTNDGDLATPPRDAGQIHPSDLFPPQDFAGRDGTRPLSGAVDDCHPERAPPRTGQH